MDFQDVINIRRSVRGYNDKVIPEEVIQKLKQALSAAPSGNNREPYKFIFVKDARKRAELAQRACHQDFIEQAQLLVVATCEKDRAFDTAIAFDHMILQAVNEGLGTCWIGWFERQEARRILGIPESMDIPIMATVGYYDNTPEKRPRKALEEITSINCY